MIERRDYLAAVSLLSYLMVSSALAAAGASVADGIRAQALTLQKAAESQVRIDHAHEKTAELLEEYRNRTRELEGLRSYDAHLEKMVAAQRASIASLEGQMERVAGIRQEILPMMARIVETLAQFVELDLPFLLNERRRGVAELENLIDNPEVPLSEKYRRVLEAYRHEIDYGRSVEAYRGTIDDSGRERVVDFLRIGRVVLAYQSLDGRESGVWDRNARRWIALSDSYGSALAKGLRIARKQAAPDPLMVPIPAPEVVP